ncbi:hypothetical protein RUM44_012745 [Polyplax serrata]|uniref:Uncharacterized protein n=1 Tax=Polyplax serrata TaxID=468196 RepID=A0ABR1BFY1_POLSC
MVQLEEEEGGGGGGGGSSSSSAKSSQSKATEREARVGASGSPAKSLGRNFFGKNPGKSSTYSTR